MCGLQTSHRYGNATMLASAFVLGIGNRWANPTPAPSISTRPEIDSIVEFEELAESNQDAPTAIELLD
jgi:glyoxylate carboligase